MPAFEDMPYPPPQERIILFTRFGFGRLLFQYDELSYMLALEKMASFETGMTKHKT